MQPGILAKTDERSEELRYVTSHFKDLQGLRLAPIWGAFLILSCAGPFLHHFPPWQRATAALPIILVGFASLVWSNHWYKRYGLVQSPQPVVSHGMISILDPTPQSRGGQSHNGVLILYFLIAMLIMPHLFQRFDGHFGGQTFPLLLMLFVLPRCLYATNGNSLIRLRRILSVAAFVVICAMYLGFLFTRSGTWFDLAGVYAVLLLLALYDHWLFSRLLSGAPAEDSHE